MTTQKALLPLQLVAGLVLLAVLARLLPHPPNFSPVVALALFCGAALAQRGLAVGAVLLAMLLSDLWLGWHSTLLAVYAALAAVTLVGHRLELTASAGRIAGHGLVGACLFFLLTNLAVWLGSGLYSPDLQGLISCYVLALPFFGNTLLGTAIYGLALFGCARLYLARSNTKISAAA